MLIRKEDTVQKIIKTQSFFVWYEQSKNNILKYDILKSYGGKQKESINHAVAGNKANIQNTCVYLIS